MKKAHKIRLLSSSHGSTKESIMVVSKYDEIIIGSGKASGVIVPPCPDPGLKGEHCCISLERKDEFWFTDLVGDHACYVKLAQRESRNIEREWFALGEERFSINLRGEVPVLNVVHPGGKQEKRDIVLDEYGIFYVGKKRDKPFSNEIGIDDEALEVIQARLVLSQENRNWQIGDYGHDGSGTKGGVFVEASSKTTVLPKNWAVLVGSHTIVELVE